MKVWVRNESLRTAWVREALLWEASRDWEAPAQQRLARDWLANDLRCYASIQLSTLEGHTASAVLAWLGLYGGVGE
eukprot:4453263-Amphidinium_carterae.1